MRTGRYVYCLVAGPAAGRPAPGGAGLDGSVTYVLAAAGISAIVHDCEDEPYRSADDRQAAVWVLAHHRVVQLAWERWEAVLPMTFNTIVAAGEGEGPDRRLRAWLRAERADLSARLDAVRGRAEYGLQVFWDAVLMERTAARSPAAEVTAGSRGLAYLQRQRRERDARRRAGAPAQELVRTVSERAGTHAEQVRIEGPREAPSGLRMVVNLSCLISREQEPALARLARELCGPPGQEARLVGPLPPYSFAR